ncbi:hypothetical protein KXS12_21265 [Priestia filamentosa]|uniref:hypothetical protein n=1 Tax=Priestia filamentosa TaxID=1402861 RepID=UPI003F144CC3
MNKYNHTERVETVDIANKWATNIKAMYDITWGNDNQVRITMDYEQIKKILDYDFENNESKMKFVTPS